jgi:L-malate glycosyltransferase
MKIFVAIPCLLRGGTETQTLLLAQALLDLGQAVTVCCYFESDQQVVEEFRMAGAVVLLLDHSRSTPPFRLIRSLAAIIRTLSPDFVHVQYMAPGLLPIIAARLARAPIVFATVHQPATPHGTKNRLLLRFAALLTTRFVCVSQTTEQSWFGDSWLLDPARPKQIARRKHLTIPNAVHLENMDRALSDPPTGNGPEEEQNFSEDLIVGAISRLSREKGIDILLKAFQTVNRAVPRSRLRIVGDGNQFDALRRLAQELNIDSKIDWMGRLPWAQAMGCMSRMDVVAVPSRFEGFGLTAVEAMAAGKPVVASRVDALAEVIRHPVSGWLVPPEAPDSLAEALIYLLNHKTQRTRMGRVGRKTVERLYGYPGFLARCRVLYALERKPERAGLST